MTIVSHIQAYSRLPFYRNSVPGDVLESIIAEAYNGSSSGSYSFVDVIAGQRGYQVKCALSTTPVTWKRVKLPNKNKLLENSSPQQLGDMVIDFCNANVQAGFDKHPEMQEIIYSRLVHFKKDNEAAYFERPLCTRANPVLFNKQDYIWSWNTFTCQTSAALVGTDLKGTKVFSWYGQGENQLHFHGEALWHPASYDKFKMSPTSISYSDLAQRLSKD